MPRKKIDSSQRKRGTRLAKLIRDAREKSGLTQEELAINAGVRIDTLRSIECGRIVSPNVFTVGDIANILKEDLNKWLK